MRLPLPPGRLWGTGQGGAGRRRRRGSLELGQHELGRRELRRREHFGRERIGRDQLQRELGRQHVERRRCGSRRRLRIERGRRRVLLGAVESREDHRNRRGSDIRLQRGRQQRTVARAHAAGPVADARRRLAPRVSGQRRRHGPRRHARRERPARRRIGVRPSCIRLPGHLCRRRRRRPPRESIGAGLHRQQQLRQHR